MFPKLIFNKLQQCGITINGPAEWDPQILNDGFYSRVIKDKNLGLGEAYIDGWWKCRRIDELLCKVIKSGVEYDIKGSLKCMLELLPLKLFNMQTRSRAAEAISDHYDLGNDLFFSFLDPLHQYSCAYFKDTDDLNEAQIKKLELIAKKLDLKKGDTLLDIGCGWGGLAKYMAANYGCEVTGINISKEQLAFAREDCKGLPVTFLDCDYRDAPGQYDKIVSVGMFEHVGHKNFETYMKTVHRLLKKNGIFLLHTIGGNASNINTDAFLNKYIFPEGSLPSAAQMTSAAEGLFVIEDLQNLGPHYDRTLMCWSKRFTNAWPKLASKYGEEFHRMWDYYLLSCAGAFRSRCIQLFQVLMTKEEDSRSQPGVCLR